MRHLTRLLDFDRQALLNIIARAEALRDGAAPKAFPDKILGLVFEKPSTRTRVSFESAAFRLGAGHIFVSSKDSQLQRGEPVKDTARVLGRYVDAVAMRTFEQSTITESAKFAGIPVINALSDCYHPCQAVADLLTIQRQLGRFEDFTMTYFGDGNNVFASLAEAAALLQFRLRFCGPEGFDPDTGLMRDLKELGAEIEIIREPDRAAAGADVVYTDVWTSMGQEEETERRKKIFAPYQINDEIIAKTASALVLHCLPAHRGEEITDSVIEGPRSRVFEQAENRMWAQMAILESVWRG